MSLEIVRDYADYPDENAARDSLPEMYAAVPFVGVWRQSSSIVIDDAHPAPGEYMEPPMWIFSERTTLELLQAGWIEYDPEHPDPQ